MVDVTTALPSPASPKTKADLEWARVLLALESRCRSPMSRDAARALPFETSRHDILRNLKEAEEATKLQRAGANMAPLEVPDIRESLERLRIGGALTAPELCAMARTLGAARGLRRSLAARKEACPLLYESCSTDVTLDDPLEKLTRSFDDDGTLADRASPRLSELRSEYQASRARMLSRLAEFMTRYEPLVQERFVTEREGRYVVPVRADAHERFPGIVHATSSSGSTLFVEPRAVVPMGNRLKMLEAEVVREEIVILAQLSAMLADVLPSLEGAAFALVRADLRVATAELAVDLGLTFPTILLTPRMDLQRARHPLLLLDAWSETKRQPASPVTRTVVPSDLSIASGRAVVVSGPNAGGKTVALKAMGLAALMARAGLPIACAEGSSIGLFEVVLTDVGDDQNLTKSLSTFSAHVQNLASILDETRPGALILLDELAGGTDPREGEALAAGVLDSLVARGGAVVATTHYEGLKALALADDRFVNASVGFDLGTMTPTFRLSLGVPGSSSALAVATRFGMPASVIQRASRFLTREDQNFESLVARLNHERAALELARAAAETREASAKQAEERLVEEIEAAKARDRKLLSTEAEALLSSLRRAKDDLRSAQATLRSKKLDELALREAARTIEHVAARASLGGDLESLTMRDASLHRRPVRVGELRRGARVFVPRLRAEGEVIDLPEPGTVRVAVGPMKLNVAAEELLSADESAFQKLPVAPKAAGRSSSAGAGTTVPIQTSDNACDVRGLRVDDAVGLMTAFVDRAINEGLGVAFVIHGHGTGALREAVRKELKASRYVSHFRAGETGEGGDGVTVVWFS